MKNLIVLALVLMSSSAFACDHLLGTYSCDGDQGKDAGVDLGRSSTIVSKDQDGYFIVEKSVMFGEERSVKYAVECVGGALQTDGGTRGMKQVLSVYETEGQIKRRMDTYESRQPDAKVFFSAETTCKSL